MRKAQAIGEEVKLEIKPILYCEFGSLFSLQKGKILDGCKTMYPTRWGLQRSQVTNQSRKYANLHKFSQVSSI